jgi:hypothetical protein
MHYRLKELQLTAIKNIPVGAVCRYVAHNGVDRFIRLADAENGRPRILILEGEYAFMSADWSHIDDLAWVICESADLRIKLGLPSESVDHRDPGLIAVVEGGAYLSCQRNKNSISFENPKLNIVSWEKHEGSRHPSLLYPTWELGCLDSKHEFQVLFTKK